MVGVNDVSAGQWIQRRAIITCTGVDDVMSLPPVTVGQQLLTIYLFKRNKNTADYEQVNERVPEMG